MSGDDFALAVVGVLCVLILVFVCGTKYAEGYRDETWEARLVDAPQEIAAIRSRVLAERAEEGAMGEPGCACAAKPVEGE